MPQKYRRRVFITFTLMINTKLSVQKLPFLVSDLHLCELVVLLEKTLFSTRGLSHTILLLSRVK